LSNLEAAQRPYDGISTAAACLSEEKITIYTLKPRLAVLEEIPISNDVINNSDSYSGCIDAFSDEGNSSLIAYAENGIIGLIHVFITTAKNNVTRDKIKYKNMGRLDYMDDKPIALRFLSRNHIVAVTESEKLLIIATNQLSVIESGSLRNFNLRFNFTFRASRSEQSGRKNLLTLSSNLRVQKGKILLLVGLL
jgi:hypothetical protein